MSHIEAYAEGAAVAAAEQGGDYTPRIALEIGGITDSAGILANPGKTNYSGVYSIDIDGADVESYTLYIKGDNGGKLTGARDITSAAAENAEALAPGQWGYMTFDDVATAGEALATTRVAALTGEEVEITSGKDNTSERNTIDVTKGVAFAVNFADDAPTGHYKSAVTLSLIASPKKVGFGSAYYMQEMNADVCKAVPVGTAGRLKDQRDGKIYTVARLQNAADAGSNKKDTANCWMTSNLAFDIKGKSDQMTVALSDVVESKTTWAAGATVQEGAFTNDTVSSTGNGLVQYSKDGAGSEDYKPEYGYYYSWCAATAGSCTDSIANDGSTGKRSASQSICPKGWKLPTGGSGGEYQALLGSSSTWANIKDGTKYNFYPAGSISTSGASSIGTRARYWSSTSYSGADAYSLYYVGSTVSPASNNTRYLGFSVRCVVEVEPTINEVNYLQEVTADVCKTLTLDTQYTLKDMRDDKSYTIARIKNKASDTSDGGANCWMTQNLALDLETKWNSTYMTTGYTDVPNNSYFSGIGTTPTKKNDKFTMGTSGSGYAGYNAMEYTNSAPTTGSGYQTSYGYYYSWCAATVGCKRGSSAGASLTSGDADASICPASWKLPSGDTDGDWYNFLNGLTGATLKNAPYKLLASGGMSSNGFDYGGTDGGYYWSRTARDDNGAYDLRFDSSRLNPGTGKPLRHSGAAVRCVVK